MTALGPLYTSAKPITPPTATCTIAEERTDKHSNVHVSDICVEHRTSPLKHPVGSQNDPAQCD